MEQENRFRCGDVREDGMVFWAYKKERNNKEYWVTPAGFEQLRRCANRAWNARRKRNVRKAKISQLKKKFGITEQWFNETMEEQRGVCAICHRAETSVFKGTPKDLAVDHCHDSGKVRGLLCCKCNTILGMAEDSVETLKSAIFYLEKHNTKRTA